MSNFCTCGKTWYGYTGSIVFFSYEIPPPISPHCDYHLLYRRVQLYSWYRGYQWLYFCPYLCGDPLTGKSLSRDPPPYRDVPSSTYHAWFIFFRYCPNCSESCWWICTNHYSGRIYSCDSSGSRDERDRIYPQDYRLGKCRKTSNFIVRKIYFSVIYISVNSFRKNFSFSNFSFSSISWIISYV